MLLHLRFEALVDILLRGLHNLVVVFFKSTSLTSVIMSASKNFKSDDELETSFAPRILFSPDTPLPLTPLTPLPSPVSPLPRRFRGKAIPWEQSLDGPTLTTLEEVINHARESNFSKIGTKNDMHRYRCRESNCSFLCLYRFAENAPFVIYTFNVHDHTSSCEAEDGKRRGLTSDQIGLVTEAFEMKNTAARPILEFIRQKRHRIEDPIALSIFPSDPVKTKLNYVIQKIKKQKGYVNYPTPRLLKDWCELHGTTTVDLNNEATHNTPFVIRYKLVSFLFFKMKK